MYTIGQDRLSWESEGNAKRRKEMDFPSIIVNLVEIGGDGDGGGDHDYVGK